MLRKTKNRAALHIWTKSLKHPISLPLPLVWLLRACVTLAAIHMFVNGPHSRVVRLFFPHWHFLHHTFVRGRRRERRRRRKRERRRRRNRNRGRRKKGDATYLIWPRREKLFAIVAAGKHAATPTSSKGGYTSRGENVECVEVYTYICTHTHDGSHQWLELLPKSRKGLILIDSRESFFMRGGMNEKERERKVMVMGSVDAAVGGVVGVAVGAAIGAE
jgi:hypothetical protein